MDRNFYQLMSSRFGNDFDNLPMKLKGPGSEFMKDFESVKKNFGLADGKTTYQLRLNMKSKVADPKYFDRNERLVTISKYNTPLF